MKHPKDLYVLMQKVLHLEIETNERKPMTLSKLQKLKLEALGFLILQISKTL